MNKIKRTAFSIIFGNLIAMAAQAQVYVPIGTDIDVKKTVPTATAKNIVARRLGLNEMTADVFGAISSNKSKSLNFPECNPTPTDMQGAYRMTNTQLSRAAAIKLNIPVASLTASGNEMVFIQDYARTVECLSTDGETTVVYGHTIRTVITIANMEVQSGLTLPAIAANATISGKQNSVDIRILGLENPKIVLLAAEISGKELNVETYGEFSRIQSELIKLTVDAGSTTKVARIGIIPKESVDGPSEFKSRVVTAYSLQQIYDGKNCTHAKSKFKQPAEPSAKAIDQTYQLIVGQCSSAIPNNQQRAQAQDYLQGLRVK